MASYFDEHDCQPRGEELETNPFLIFARRYMQSLIDGELDLDFDPHELFGGEKAAPPASKKAINELPSLQITKTQAATGTKCPVCLADFHEEETVRKMPCKHFFHPSCLLPWLAKTNSCPCCRHELPTDDEEYEEQKREKARKAQREYELESLHDSMYG